MSNRGLIWLERLAENGIVINDFSPSVKVIDAQLNNETARFISIIPDKDNHYPRATKGEVGLLEGWNVAKAIQQIIQKDLTSNKKTPIVAIIDVPSQAYGRREEAYGIHLALAAAANAYVQARIEGHPIIGLIVGKAMSGGFLAHGYQASRLIALNDTGCMVHAMGKESAARITLRTVEQLEALTASIPPMAYDIQSYDALGLLWKVVDVHQAEKPINEDITLIKGELINALNDIKLHGNDLSSRFDGENRKNTLFIRKEMELLW